MDKVNNLELTLSNNNQNKKVTKEDIAFVINAKTGNSDNRTPITVNGCLVKILDREKVFPIYVEGICLGYYYVKYIPAGFSDSGMFKNSVVASGNKKEDSVANVEDDKMLRYLCNKIACRRAKMKCKGRQLIF